jgi:hypothetical protein
MDDQKLEAGAMESRRLQSIATELAYAAFSRPSAFIAS